ncbi:GVQW3 [Cordylochernes scorpioides]|uniref:GVQW3 n=1 Tax=Cordylochernes scorpioides TaxID=51811 RepID=A0ABY6KCH8_9ARAC|nr:GVQW3 [Cordylochernes scorpioides]
MSRRRVFEWYKRFKESREETADNERSGRPSTSTTPEKLDKVLELKSNPYSTWRAGEAAQPGREEKAVPIFGTLLDQKMEREEALERLKKKRTILRTSLSKYGKRIEEYDVHKECDHEELLGQLSDVYEELRRVDEEIGSCRWLIDTVRPLIQGTLRPEECRSSVEIWTLISLAILIPAIRRLSHPPRRAEEGQEGRQLDPRLGRLGAGSPSGKRQVRPDRVRGGQEAGRRRED